MVLLTTGLALPALAQDGVGLPGAVTATSRPPLEWALAMHVSRLVLPLVEAKVELALGHGWSCAIVGGAGRHGGTALDTVSSYGAGAQVLYHMAGTFRRGFHGGPTVRYTFHDGRAQPIEGPPGSGTSHDLLTGAVIGARTTRSGGLMIDAQVTGGWRIRQTTLRCCGTVVSEADTSGFGWLATLGVGFLPGPDPAAQAPRSDPRAP